MNVLRNQSHELKSKNIISLRKLGQLMSYEIFV